MGLNIRVVKLSNAFVKRGQLKSDKSFLITEGYPDTIEECKKKIVIHFCPFCGERLMDWYHDEVYVTDTMV